MTKTLKVTRLASDLKLAREAVADFKKGLVPLEEEVENIEAQLLGELRATRMDTVRFEGYNFIRTQKTTFKVNDPKVALEWAKENCPGAIKPESVDTAKAQTILKRGDLPDGFERTDTEFLSIRKADNNNSDE